MDSMSKINLLLGICTVCVGLFALTNAQLGAKNTVPETVSSCYRNYTAYNRYTRQPMHIDNLIAIIRKVERKDPQWDMRRIARTLVNRYMFDGIEFNPSAKLDFQFNPKSEEATKSMLVKRFIKIPIEEIFPSGALDNDDMCALHWMLSHSMNATARDEEIYGGQYPNGGYNPGGYNPNGGGGYNPNPGYGYNSNSNPSGQQRWKRSADEDDDFDNNSEIENESSNDDSPAPAANLNPVNDSNSEEKYIESAPMSGKENNENDSNSSGSQDDQSSLPSRGRSVIMLSLPSDSEDESHKSARQVSQKDDKKTRRPIETGVVYTPWGSISAGRLIAGIAAGLEPEIIPVNSGSAYIPSGYGAAGPGSGSGYGGNGGYNNGNPASIPGSNPFGNPYPSTNNNPYPNNNNPSGSNPIYSNQQNPSYPSKSQWAGRKKRQIPSISFQPLQSIYAVTLAGDVGQSAILNGKFELQNAPLPRGIWNDTTCPREYVLEPHPYADREIYEDTASWTYLTEAEVRGGMDGLIMGMNVVRWNPSNTMKLSELLSMYYSETGIVGEPHYRACNRGSNFNGAIDANTLREQSRSFAYYYNNHTQTIQHSQIEQNPNSFLQTVDEAYQKMSGVAGSVGSSDPICKRRQSVTSSAVDSDDAQKFTELNIRIYAVIDHTATYEEINQQKRFLAQLAHEVNVSPRGSRMGVVDGSSGMLLINPNQTDNNAVLACNIIALPNHAKILFASSKYQQSDFDGFALKPDKDFLRIQGVQNLSDYSYDFANQLRGKTHGRLSYTKCNVNKHNQDNEHKIQKDFFVTPDTIDYYKISPDYFYSSKNLRLRFTSDNGKVRVCQSRRQMNPNSRNQGSDGTTCKETKGSYVTPGNSEIDVEFSYSKPCGKHGDRPGCEPIYISVTPTNYPGPGQVGLDCSIEDCAASNQVKVTFTHWDMRCNGAFRNMISLPMALTMMIISLVFWKNST